MSRGTQRLSFVVVEKIDQELVLLTERFTGRNSPQEGFHKILPATSPSFSNRSSRPIADFLLPVKLPVD